MFVLGIASQWPTYGIHVGWPSQSEAQLPTNYNMNKR